jgi:hypothetical protein
MKPLPSSFGAIGSLVSVSLATSTKMSLPVLSLGASAESGILIIRQTLEEIYLAIGVFETCKAGVIHIHGLQWALYKQDWTSESRFFLSN